MKNKKGISLITLIITIVVVIILAAAVILSLGNNNPVNSSKLASLLKSKETMEECVKLVVSHKVSETLGQSMTRDVIIVEDDTEIIDNSVDSMSATKNGESLTLYRVDANDYKNKFGVKLSDTPNTNSKWYVDERGRMFLVYDFIENVPEFMKESNTTLNNSVESFVIITGQELENSIIESAEITIPEETVGIGENKNLTVDLSNVKNLSYCKWVINTSNTKLGTEDETKYPNTLDSNNAEISLSSITEPGNYYLHMLIVTTTNQKVEKISSKIIVEKKPDVWDGSVATSFAGGTGTQNDPYIIETAAELAYFRNNVNNGNKYSGKYVKLINHIDLNSIEWVPIGKGNNNGTFSGYFNGENHKISNINMTQYSYSMGIFGYCEDAEIRNFTVSGNINSETNSVGGIVGIAKGNTIIENCINYINIKSLSQSQYGTGGILGYADNSNIEISNCKNYGNIDGYYGVSGIVGRAISINKITNCSNHGEIKSYWYSGGIAGQIKSGELVENCYNIGKITSSSWSGGIIGEIESSCRNINYCYNSGDIFIEEQDAGGIVGDSYNVATITSCYNTGTITGPGDYVGGIVGSGRSNSKVYNSYSKGNIVITGSDIYYGGIKAGTNPYAYNSYYLDTSCDRVDYYNKITTTSGAPKEEQYFIKDYKQTDSIAYLLNEGKTDDTRIWTVDSNINDGYPILMWQLD